MHSTNTVYRLNGQVRHYPWGECASAATPHPYIPQLLGVEAGAQPWAELWLGAHPALPSTLDDGTPLGDAIREAPAEWLGKAGGTELAYLFKVLSCRRALSIQTHPDEQSAIRLHAERPDLYGDPHDKTEIIIALTQFAAMAGWRQPAAIRDSLERRSALRSALLPLWQENGESDSLRVICQKLFAMGNGDAAALIAGLKAELSLPGAVLTDAEELFLSLEREYPADRGALFAFLLNHCRLAPGEALFLAPNSPHAYLCGTGIECMTNSDNVIRAGLTGKPVDVPTLLSTVDFHRFGTTPVAPHTGKEGTGRLLQYLPPTRKFRITVIENTAFSLEHLPEGMGILLILSGAMRLEGPGYCRDARRGSAWVCPSALRAGNFIPASEDTIAVWVQTAFAG